MSMKLAILGLLEGDHHPYEIRIKMKDRGMDQYTKLQMGSLYYAVDRLAEDGYIEAVETIQSDSRPDKTIYRITDAGRKLLAAQEIQGHRARTPPALYCPTLLATRGSGRSGPDLAVPYPGGRASGEPGISIIRGTPAYRTAQHLMIGMYEHAKTDLNWLKG